MPCRTIKFSAYPEDWIDTRFDEAITRVSVQSKNPNLPRVEYEDIVSGEGVLNKDVCDKESTKTGQLFKKNEVLFGKLRPYLKNILLAKFDGIGVGDFWILRPASIDKSFLYALLNSYPFQRIANMSTGTKMPRADWNLVRESVFAMPKTLEEQTLTGSLYTSFEQTIASRKSILNCLKSLKKSFLNAMFPTHGKELPMVRLGGYSTTWKTSKLEDFLKIREDVAGDLFSKNDVLSVSGDFGVVNQIEFQGRSFAGASIANYRVVNKGNVIYTKSPLKIYPYGIIKTAKKDEGIVSPLYAVYNAKDNCDPFFVQTYFESKERLNLYLRRLVNKGAKNTLLISDEAALQGEVVFPEREEQEAISHFFMALDSLIHLHEEEIEKFSALKQSYLQGMFV